MRTCAFKTLWLLAGLAAAAPFVRAELTADLTAINIAVEMTSAGKKVAHPTPDNPAYYFPVSNGFSQRGSVYAGEAPPPTPRTVEHILAEVLAEQGYLVTNALHKPSIVLSFNWGSLNPVTGADGTITNIDEMMALVAGKTFGSGVDSNSFEYRQAIQNAHHDRYFILVTAYDYEAYTLFQKKVKLWEANISVPGDHGITLAGVLPMMARAAGPSFGVETLKPVSILKELPRGDVEMGPTTVVPDKPLGAGPASPGSDGGTAK